jgi:hypothetical protein
MQGRTGSGVASEPIEDCGSEIVYLGQSERKAGIEDLRFIFYHED